MKKTGLNRYVYNFSINYNLIHNSNIDIHRYLMKKYDIKQSLDLLKKYLSDY